MSEPGKMVGFVLKYQGTSGYKAYFNDARGWVHLQSEATIYKSVTQLIQSIVKSPHNFDTSVSSQLIIVGFVPIPDINYTEVLIAE